MAEHTGDKQKVKIESMATEEKGQFSLKFKWDNKGEVYAPTGFNTPIIEFAKANPSSTKKSGYLSVCASNLNAIVNPWVPCGALKSDALQLQKIGRTKRTEKIKSYEEDVEITAPEKYIYPTFHGGLFFKVENQGRTEGGATVKIIGVKQYYNEHNVMAVFGYPNETLEQALQNDKRFEISGQFALKQSGTTYKSDVRLSELISKDTYTIIVHRSKQSRKPLAKGKKDLPNNQGGTFPVPGTSVPQFPVNPCHQPEPVSSHVSSKFSSEFHKLAKIIGEETLMSELNDDYKKNVVYKDPMMATIFRLLNTHLDSVALLRYDVGGNTGSGTLFLLTPSLGITCYHVLEKLRDVNDVKVEVIFNYESKENVVCGTYKGVLCFNEELDYAFVHVETLPILPGLLDYIAPPPQDGAVTIIGHPNTEHKQVDFNCSVINYNKRAVSILGTLLSDRSYIHVLTKYSFVPMSDETLMTYDSCLYEGASGSPVFNNCGELVAVHTAGYIVETPLKKKSVIEYGRSAVDIVIHGAIQFKEVRDVFRELVKRKENLARYLQPGGHPDKMQPIIRKLLQLWEESDSQLEQNPGVHTSNDFNNMPDSQMDTS